MSLSEGQFSAAHAFLWPLGHTWGTAALAVTKIYIYFIFHGIFALNLVSLESS